MLAALSTGVLDALRAAPKDESSLARETGAHAPSLFRFLRALERMGIVQRSGGTIGSPRWAAVSPIPPMRFARAPS